MPRPLDYLTHQKFKLLWEKAQKEQVKFIFPKTPAGMLEAHKLYASLKYYKHYIRKNKLNLLHTREYNLITSCSLVKLNRTDFILRPTKGREPYYVERLKKLGKQK